MAELAVDALVVTSLPNILYLTNFSGSSAIVVIEPESVRFLTDSRYTEVVERGQQTDHACPDLVVDLRDVSFIDCSGLRVLCRARRRVEARHGRLRLLSDDPSFLRILRRTGLGGAFEVHSRLGGPAVRAAASPVPCRTATAS